MTHFCNSQYGLMEADEKLPFFFNLGMIRDTQAASERKISGFYIAAAPKWHNRRYQPTSIYWYTLCVSIKMEAFQDKHKAF